MHLFYAPDITPPEYTLEGQEGRHAVKVLRFRPGDAVALTDGRGGMYSAEVTAADGAGCRLRVMSEEHGYGKRPYGLTMAVAPTKNGDRYEWFLEKATEIGCDRFIPLVCDRSERRVFRGDRSLRVITSAVKQSLSAYHPVLDEPMRFSELISAAPAGSRFIAHCDRGFERIHLADAVTRGGDNMVLIGPEGDFSPAEIELAEAHGFTGVSLGNGRLRTETAAVTAAAIVALANR
ncbi:MAG: 16S rRNA (uracil(1498)-N(3))-methyltransferase [Rikenellaceae bacterium]|nr:16S rRNA (uracil(1498)-N(3))-methyltransferase [Rikenellaceae bacterium]